MPTKPPPTAMRMRRTPAPERESAESLERTHGERVIVLCGETRGCEGGYGTVGDKQRLPPPLSTNVAPCLCDVAVLAQPS